MILIIDNYDSFTYNLVQYFGELGTYVVVRRNDKVNLAEVEALHPDHICISPGPCTPQEAGISKEIVNHFGSRLPILGVCLGHQCIGAAFGGKVVRAKRLMHGKTSSIFHGGKGIFMGLANPFQATRYHSLLLQRASLPDCLGITAETAEKEIMGIQHTVLPIHGVQFHPESILTENGRALLQNFLQL